MCFKPEEPNCGTEREKLERAIKRLEKRDWCDDAKIALAAARKHLESLPKPRRKVSVVRYLVVGKTAEWGPYSDQYDAHRIAFNRDSQVVELRGEYER